MNPTLQKITDLLDERKWSMYRLAKESGIPYSSLSSMFHKNNMPTLSTLEKICSGLHISLSEFFADSTPYRIESYRFSDDELMILELYRSLNQYDKNMLTAYIKGFCKKPLNEKV